MKRITLINMTAQGSTGNIMLQIAKLANEMHMEAKTYSTICYRNPKERKQKLPHHVYYGFYTENFIHTALAKITGFNGCFTCFGTKKLIHELEKFQPDIIHLHNLHQYCINLPMLFRYIKRNQIKVVWTLHDCWAFTGHCPHFLIAGCEKWKEECLECPQYKKYPRTYVDRSKIMHRLKKKWFGEMKNLTLVTPSKWLASMVRESFLKEHEIQVIPNGIDLTVFKPTDSDVRQKYHLEDKKIVLGVSDGWSYAKGLDVFVELAKQLDNRYQIVLVGTNERVDKVLPSNIVSIHRTGDKEELAKLYSAADVFVNPTREDTFPTVNIEALACGTPVVTFDVGGSPEIIDDRCGVKVKSGDICDLKKKIEWIGTKAPFGADICRKRGEQFAKEKTFQSYIELYQRM